VHALTFFFGWLPFCGFLILSYLNQCVRYLDHRIECCQFAKASRTTTPQRTSTTATPHRILPCATRAVSSAHAAHHPPPLRRCSVQVLEGAQEPTGRLTALAQRQLAYVEGWEWTDILCKASVIGYVLWVFKYGATLTYILLNALIAALLSLHWLATSLIFVTIGTPHPHIEAAPSRCWLLAAAVSIGTPSAHRAHQGRAISLLAAGWLSAGWQLAGSWLLSGAGALADAARSL
jgi:hypothetical protein